MTNSLAPQHLKMLREGSCIAEDVIEARGYRTITDAEELREMGFALQQCRVPALLQPLWTVDGKIGFYVLRPDNPRVIEDKAHKLPDGTYKSRVVKYETPKGAAMRFDCHPFCREELGNPGVPLIFTEGIKKADSLLSAYRAVGRPVCVIALLGVFNWRGKNENGGTTVLADLEYIAW